MTRTIPCFYHNMTNLSEFIVRFLKNCFASQELQTQLLTFFNIYSLNNIFLESKSQYYAKNRSGSDKSKKEILLLSSFAFIRKQAVVRSMDHLLKRWYESPEAAITRTIHSQG